MVVEQIGLYGGTFDPPHLGHLVSAQALAEELGLTRVVFVPSGNPPHKQDHPISSAEHRIAMLRLALEGNPAFQINEWELRQAAPTYTINSVLHYQAEFPSARLFWLIGLDSLRDLPSWYRFDQLIETVEIATAYRGGLEVDRVLAGLRERLTPGQFDKLHARLVRTPMIEICAHDIRRRVREGHSIRYLVPGPIEEYIRREGLYR
jgi:nicotinate-nucleotide adenylyltransferase